ncbi:MAG: beta-hexosaminidase, partial [Proteobacteria bacterium]|nr:beta-hexosaminidase [Pseudomonadota bacterium]
HGRGGVDSHISLPRVDVAVDALRQSDFVPFMALADLPFGMTAHILFTALDQTEPATTSATIIEQVIRKDIGFGGVLMSDDLNMEALGRSLGERAARSRAAGCDLVLHCNGDLEQMREVAAALKPVSIEQSTHLINAMRGLKSPGTFDSAAALAERDALLEGVLN